MRTSQRTMREVLLMQRFYCAGATDRLAAHEFLMMATVSPATVQPRQREDDDSPPDAGSDLKDSHFWRKGGTP
ncbi:hypothetical protein BJF92_21910 [Rhizobium rhizosphaerae]|uniref:Uncharacterized protein n=1 Tax=Xaviernesmea rhizosphaerae TaxID=1672749 RepID=A0A1Q9AJ16_9HYPH|nr:hypothetical protein BJF92_21910 [Xaviernesmea rhizosphaerae]